MPSHVEGSLLNSSPLLQVECETGIEVEAKIHHVTSFTESMAQYAKPYSWAFNCENGSSG
jgi:hypothetical protein